jgi:hypothetical protein
MGYDSDIIGSERTLYQPSLYTCTTPNRHKLKLFRSSACANCKPVRDSEKTAKMATLTKVQYFVLIFVYWNPDCLEEDFRYDHNFFGVPPTWVDRARKKLLSNGLLENDIDDIGRTTWRLTSLAEDYLDEP